MLKFFMRCCMDHDSTPPSDLNLAVILFTMLSSFFILPCKYSVSPKVEQT